ncbi:hypothetical protein ASE86_10560 [Sphingomonas sp. Leaf33]|uniref:hypothetical protein n=1 Tax=Sphingomonas sp. Leaf33 TaxID=1736215 RepID=UPI0006FEA4EB|nr:hypothetical protein [Sphingomonas sp. Leaf33]KQN26530.1 hypothetical protein ASE86_10560 [Sphingomonas sp. Leaf33]
MGAAMFGSIKPTASLSSGLLARKGQARPAMRPQGFHGPAGTLDDLGWNDMGAEAPEPAPVVPLTPAVAPPVAVVPPVLVARETLREEIEAAAVTVPAPKAVALPAKGKAAFTLRLDPDRHLRLRLASASRNRSAQAIVVAALDAFLATLPEVDGLAQHLTVETASRGKS